MACAIEDAGFEIRDQIMWVYGSGFPKSHNIGKAIDKKLGCEREVVKVSKNSVRSKQDYVHSKRTKSEAGMFNGDGNSFEITKGSSEWEGWGTALKPAHEPIVMARKPFKGTVAKNILKWRTGGINIKDCRIEMDDEKVPRLNIPYPHKTNNNFGGGNDYRFGTVAMSQKNNEGRFPSNIIFDEIAGKILDQQSGISKSFKRSSKYNKKTGYSNSYTPKSSNYRDNNTYNDKGGASRFFYCPKPSKNEKEEGLTSEPIQIKGRDEGQDNRNVPQKLRKTNRRNTHTTVKPIKLMQYLIRLVTPKGGVTIDPYFGSGSSGKSTIREGNYKFLGIEKEKEYFNIAVERCQFEYEQSLKVAA
jgi:site-specific DNA-methyltransferase (adenine-specific)